MTEMEWASLYRTLSFVVPMAIVAATAIILWMFRNRK